MSLSGELRNTPASCHAVRPVFDCSLNPRFYHKSRCAQYCEPGFMAPGRRSSPRRPVIPRSATSSCGATLGEGEAPSQKTRPPPPATARARRHVHAPGRLRLAGGRARAACWRWAAVAAAEEGGGWVARPVRAPLRTRAEHRPPPNVPFTRQSRHTRLVARPLLSSGERRSARVRRACQCGRGSPPPTSPGG